MGRLYLLVHTCDEYGKISNILSNTGSFYTKVILKILRACILIFILRFSVCILVYSKVYLFQNRR